MFDQPGDDFGLVPLRPVGGIVDKLQIRVREQSSQMAREAGVEVIVVRAENQRDRQVETGQVTSGDVRVLLIECGKQSRGPSPDGCQRVRLVTVSVTILATSDGMSPGRSPAVTRQLGLLKSPPAIRGV